MREDLPTIAPKTKTGKKQNVGGAGAKGSSQKARNTAARLTAVQLVYDMMITGHSVQDVLSDYREHRYNQPMEDVDYVPADLTLLANIVRGVAERRTDLVDMLQAALKDGTRDILPEVLLRSILLCGAYEMMAHPELDTPLLIAEYNHVTDGFFAGEESKLVQAVLDRLAKALRA